MKKFVAVIGPAESGKSTIIQSLTGCKTKSFNGFVQDNSTHNRVYVIASSLQESGMKKNEFLNILRRVGRDAGCSGIVVAIQLSEPWKRMSMEETFDIINKFGSFRIILYVLNQTYDNKKNIFKTMFRGRYNSKREPRLLNAKRFSFFNAKIIQRTSKILRR
jgi:ABC-type branched-subunit amino acid transport system ATPase component